MRADRSSTPSAPWEAVRDELLYQRGAPYAEAAEFSYPSPYVVDGAGAGRVRARVVRRRSGRWSRPRST